ncbi:hypothetical protein [Szabonella alba]|uniref:Uncharacterized protein n=1 Tax=Szabonella alba TaxID=2804194 RepID=A0A8K0V568_9RHOB|nr:hypothetical protein [Szabonella alba]MBL4915608.1 hypothetical protein [Szabonella alba]
MADPGILNPHPPEFERFLYASVGEDRNGHAVTVLSAFARKGLDPWRETADLVALRRDAARLRLGQLLARFRDVPALATDHGRVARDLSQLLPERPSQRSLKHVAGTVTDGRAGTSRAILTILAISFVLVQVLMVAGSGSGE